MNHYPFPLLRFLPLFLILLAGCGTTFLSNHTDCLSQLCLTDARDNTMKCSTNCDNSSPCLPGYQCKSIPNCPNPQGCSACFPLY